MYLARNFGVDLALPGEGLEVVELERQTKVGVLDEAADTRVLTTVHW